MFDVIETLISDLDLEACDSISVPARRTSRSNLPDTFRIGSGGQSSIEVVPQREGQAVQAPVTGAETPEFRPKRGHIDRNGLRQVAGLPASRDEPSPC